MDVRLAQKFATDTQRDAYVKAGATHLILELGELKGFTLLKTWLDGA
jgi:hypothetical protein